MEIEAKYTIAAETQFEGLLRAESFGPYMAGPIAIREVEDVYLDTADLRILGGGFACRLRGQSPAGAAGSVAWTALLKGLGGAQGGVHQRTELEIALPQFEPDPAHWPAGEAREQALALTGGAPVRTLVALSQTRHVRLLHAGERLVAELSLDRVSIRAGAAPSGRIDLEVEAEAKGDGTVEDVRTLAGVFEADWSLTPQPLSKLERALAGASADAASVGVAPSDRLRPGDRPRLERIAATARSPQARRARLLLAWADGADVHRLQDSLGYSRSSVYFWIDAYTRSGLDVFPVRVLASAEAPAAAPRAARGPRSMPCGPEANSPPDRPTAAPDEVVASKVPEHEPIPLADLLRRHQVDLSHARHVADLAVRLFDLTTDLHHLSAESRSLLEKAGLLHNLGLAADPAHHHTAGRDLLLAAPVVDLTDLERQMIAAVIFLHRKRISPEKLEKKTMTALPEDRRRETLALAALVRVADGLDSSLSQMTRIVGGQVSAVTVDVILSGPLATEDAARAQVKADLWDLLQPLPFRFLSDAGRSLEVATDDVDADADAPAPAQIAAVMDSAADAREQPPAPPLDAAERQSSEVEASAPEPEPVAASPLLDFVLSAVPTDAPGIVSDEAAADAGRKVFAFHLVRVLQHEPGARQGEDIEEVHDMRVAVRRLRSAFRVFGDAFHPAALAPFAKQLRRTGEVLGAVRDLDVLSANARRYQATLPVSQSNALEPLLQAWATQREVARRRLIKYLNGEGYAGFTAAFAEFVTAPGEGARRPDPARPEPYLTRHVAPCLIYTAFERVRAYEPLLAEPYLELLHALRIEGKRLRYTLEFLREVLGPEAALVIAETTALQDHLGSLHDADVAELLLRNFLNGMLALGPKGAPRPRVLAPGVASYLAARQVELQDLLDGFPAAWARFNRPEVRRSLALAVSVL